MRPILATGTDRVKQLPDAVANRINRPVRLIVQKPVTDLNKRQKEITSSGHPDCFAICSEVDDASDWR